MGLRKILTVSEPSLHKVCKPMVNFDNRLYRLLDDMRETLIDSGGVGLAAPQVGILRRVVLVTGRRHGWRCRFSTAAHRPTARTARPGKIAKRTVTGSTRKTTSTTL